MANEIERPEGIADAFNVRRMILIATMRKAVDTSKAISLLSDDVANFENINILTRCLIESVVNGAYLQTATDDEVKTYQAFDVIPVSKIKRYVDGVAPTEFSKHISETRLAQFDAHVDKVKQDTGKTDKDFGWTRMDVASRCAKIDEQFGQDAFALLGRGLFPIGHPYVHGNFQSLKRRLPMADGVQAYRDGIDQTLFIEAQVLAALASFVNRRYKLACDDELANIGEAFGTFTKRLLGGVHQAMRGHP